MLNGAPGSWTNLYWSSWKAEVSSANAVEYVDGSISMFPKSGALDPAGMAGEYYGGE